MQIIRKLSEKKSCLEITKELRRIGPQDHDPYDPSPLSSLILEERRSIMKSRWVIGPRPGSELKGRFLCKGDSSKSSQGMTSMPQPRNQQPSSSFFS